MKYAHSELLYKYSGNVLKTYFNCILFVISSVNKPGECKREELVPFPVESFKNLAEFTETHNCLKILLEILIEFIRTQNIVNQFNEVPEVFFNKDLIYNVYTVLMSILKYVLKKVYYSNI